MDKGLEVAKLRDRFYGFLFHFVKISSIDLIFETVLLYHLGLKPAVALGTCGITELPVVLTDQSSTLRARLHRTEQTGFPDEMIIMAFADLLLNITQANIISDSARTRSQD